MPQPYTARGICVCQAATVSVLAVPHRSGFELFSALLSVAGLMFIRHSNRTMRFLEAWDELLQQQDRQHWDQGDFNDLLHINMFQNG